MNAESRCDPEFCQRVLRNEIAAARRAGRAEGLREANEKHAPLLAAAKALLAECERRGDECFSSKVNFARFRELDAAVAALLARAEEVERNG